MFGVGELVICADDDPRARTGVRPGLDAAIECREAMECIDASARTQFVMPPKSRARISPTSCDGGIMVDEAATRHPQDEEVES